MKSLEEVDGFILKSKSPSCAITDAKIFPAPASTGHVAQGSGLFAGAALEEYRSRAFVDETGLNYRQVRAGFLTKIFALAGFREVKKSGRTARLVRYHAENKLLFLAYHQETMREMGRIAANHEKRAFSEVVSAYESALLRLLAHPPSRSSWVSALAHALGHLSEKISKEEKMRFLDAIEEYREGRTPLDGPLETLREWTARAGSEHLEGQTIFEPYPRALRVNPD